MVYYHRLNQSEDSRLKKINTYIQYVWLCICLYVFNHNKTWADTYIWRPGRYILTFNLLLLKLSIYFSIYLQFIIISYFIKTYLKFFYLSWLL